MEELEESVWSVVRHENEREDQGEGLQDSGKTSTDVRGRDMGVEEGTGKEIGGRRNENATMDMRSYEAGQIRNERISGTTKVGENTKKVQGRRLKWYGLQIEEHYVGRRAMETKVQGRRKRGRLKRRWLDKVNYDIKEKGLSAEEVYDRATWRRMSSYIDHT